MRAPCRTWWYVEKPLGFKILRRKCFGVKRELIRIFFFIVRLPPFSVYCLSLLSFCISSQLSSCSFKSPSASFILAFSFLSSFVLLSFYFLFAFALYFSSFLFSVYLYISVAFSYNLFPLSLLSPIFFHLSCFLLTHLSSLGVYDSNHKPLILYSYIYIYTHTHTHTHTWFLVVFSSIFPE
jgi:hypothetical protein